MSKYIDELIADIAKKPSNWTPLGSEVHEWVTGGAMNEGLKSTDGTIILQRHRVIVRDVAIPSTFMDRVRLRSAIKRWYRTVTMPIILRS